MRTLACLLLLVPLFGCGRPQPGEEDLVQPGARPVDPPPAPEPAEPTVLSITSPEEGATLPEGGVTIELSGGSGEPLLGFVDQNEPGELAASGPIELGDLGGGWHVVRLVRYGDEGLDLSDGGLLIRSFAVGDEAGEAPYDVTGPVLTLAAPRASVAPLESGEVALEFRVDGVAVGETEGEAKVVWRVDDGEPEELFVWPPPEALTLGPFEPGVHKLVIELVDSSGAPLENGGLTRVERFFTVPEQETAG